MLTVKPESEDLFKQLTKAFMGYNRSLGNCFNYNINNTYQTNFSCLSLMCEGRNVDIKIKQITNEVYVLFSRTISTQKFVVKDWIQNAIAHKCSNTAGLKTRSLVLPGVYVDVPSNRTRGHTTPTNGQGLKRLGRKDEKCNRQ